MAAGGQWTFTNAGRTQLMAGTFLFGTHTFKMALFQGTSNLGPGSTTYAGLTNEVATANGYTIGGVSVTVSQSGTQVVTVASTNGAWTATGGNITARSAVVYDVTTGMILCYCLLDATNIDVTATNGSPFNVNISGSGLIIAS